MQKKVLIISASPRKGGNSDVLCDRFLQGAREAGHDVEKIFTKDKDINYCIGCGICFEKQTCSQQDDMVEILDKMIKADVIVLATPVYFYSVNGQMKTFIDRVCAKYSEVSDKEFYLIMAAADESDEAFSGTLETFRCFTSCLKNPVVKGILKASGVFHVGEVKKTPFMERAYSMGKDI